MDLTDTTTNFVHGFKIKLRNWNCMKKKKNKRTLKRKWEGQAEVITIIIINYYFMHHSFH